MNKLELKHLAPYLPYGLKFKDCYGSICTLRRLDYDSPENARANACDAHGGLGLFNITPYLHPLSDLTFEDLDNLGNRYDVQSDPTNKDDRPFVFRTSDNSTNPLEWRYDDIEYLHSKHFDTKGLIEKGLAIDINTL